MQVLLRSLRKNCCFLSYGVSYKRRDEQVHEVQDILRQVEHSPCRSTRWIAIKL